MSSLCEELCQCLCPCSKPAPYYRKRKDDDDYDDAEAGHFQWSQQQYHGSSPLYEYAVRSKSPAHGDNSRYRGSNVGGSAQIAAAYNKQQQAARSAAASSLPRPYYEEVPSSSLQQQQQRRPSYNNNDSSQQQQHQQQPLLIPAIGASPDVKQRAKTIATTQQHPPQPQQQPHQHYYQGSQLYTLPTSDASAIDISHVHNHHDHQVQRQPAVLPGLRGTQPLVTLNRLGILSADLNNSNNSVASTASLQLYQQQQPGGTSNSQVQAPSTLPNNQQQIQQQQHQQQQRNHAFLPLVSSQEMSCQELIGGGAFGQVWRGSWRGTPVAIKVLSSACQGKQLPAKLLQSFEEEVSLLARMRHPNICLLLAICMEPSHRAIVTELVSRGSLWDALRRPTFQQQHGDNSSGSSRDGPFHWPLWVIRRVLEGAGRGLIYLHTHDPPIIHRDLKSANLLLDDSFHAKICDFGLARLRDMTAVLTANVGTVQWMAPEVLLGVAYDEKVDVYSLALVLWEMLTGQCPYEGMQQVEVALAVVNGHARPAIPPHCTTEQKEFLQRCWATRPEHRPTAAVLVEEAVCIFRYS